MATTTTTPCYVFRLIKFDEQGNKIQKRKYGFTAKSTSPSELDEQVFNGIITRAEQTFNLRPSTYSLYLVLGSTPYIHELGETDLHLYDYPALSSHSWTALHTFNQFNHKRDLIANLKGDKKGRKVVNLCLITGTTLHDVARAYKLKNNLDSGGLLNHKVKGKGKEMEESQQVNDTAAVISNAEVSPASSSVEEDTVIPDPPTPTIGHGSPPPSELQQDEKVDNDEQKKAEGQEKNRSTSPAAQAAQEVADLVAKFTNFIAPLPVPSPLSSGNANANTVGGSAGNFGTHPGMDFIKRAADFIAPAPAPVLAATATATSAPSNVVPPTQPPIDFAASLAAAARAASNTHHQATFGKRRHWSEYLTDGLDSAYNNSPASSTGGGMSGAQASPLSSSSTAPTSAVPSIGESLQKSMNSAIQARDRATKAREEAIKKRLEAMKSYPFGSRSFLSPRGHYNSASSTAGAGAGSAPAPAQSTERAATTASASTSSTSSNEKYTTLKSSFDKFVSDFNANLADAFGGPAPEIASTSPSIKREDKKTADASSGQTVFEARGEKEATATGGAHRHCGAAAHGQGEAHNATCDVCDDWIVGVRYKCFVCPDWDCCEKCFAKVDQIHPGHALAALKTSSDLIRRKSTPLSLDNASARHFAIHCDGCMKPIYGIRYKCTHQSCPDFDLCANCEADPTSYLTTPGTGNNKKRFGNHSFNDHLMLKIRKPVVSVSSSFTFGSGAGTANRVQLERAVENARKVASSSANNAATASTTTSTGATVGNVPNGEKKDKTCIIDVPLPFAIPGGEKDIHLTFDIGTNEKGETIILNRDGASASIAEAIRAAFKEAAITSPAPTATPTSDKATTVSEDEVTSDTKNATQSVESVKQKSQMTDARVAYDARWINDVTFGDGESVFPGTVFNKVWEVENTGTRTWPAGTQLICVSGFGKDTASQHGGRKEVTYTVKPTRPGAKVHIVAEDIVAPEIGGKFMSYYRFVAPGGTRFGDRLWIDIIVDEDQSSSSSNLVNKTTDTSASNNQAASSSSLDSSRVVTPTLKVKGSTSNIQDAATESVATSEAITSPRSTASGLPDTETMSEISDSLDDEEEDCDFVLLTDDDDYDQI